MNNYENAEGVKIREMFTPQLQEGEKIQWCGAASERLTMKERGMSAKDLIFPIFCVALCIIASVIIIVNMDSMGIVLTVVFMAVVLAVLGGAGFTLQRVIFGVRNLYVITNQKLYLLTSKGKIDTALELTDLSSIYSTPGRGNTGTVSMRNSSEGKHSGRVYVNLIGIEYPKKVCDILTEAVDDALILKKKSQNNKF